MNEKIAEIKRRYQAKVWTRLPFMYSFNSRIPQKKRDPKKAMRRLEGSLNRLDIKSQPKKRSVKPKTGTTAAKKAKMAKSGEQKSGGSKPIPNPEQGPGPSRNMDAGDNPVANPVVDPNATGA
ncbi:uncharacterized protein Dana_GF19048 [Drosophila ananassae]|uniref:Uncharacterized protein n=1 Tax=Drosophila ananassae TaxID=7217 RepID=B3MZW9_DROAN|nr:uncharacterized protein LOC6501812 [Drosophila ananassae]EDV33920.2 uncharacterized protein Dana_GF19048 [Drosophila ananassae]